MDSSTLITFLTMQLWSIPQLVVLAVGIVVVLGYGSREKFVVLAVSGCVLMLLSLLISAGQNYWMLTLTGEGTAAADVARTVYSPKLVMLNRVVALAGLGLIIAGVVAGRARKA
jgi:hypothetical protein